jgi:hypothetical protein
MSSWLQQRGGRLGLIAIALVGLTIGGVAYATIPDGGGVIRACYSVSTGPGALRVIDTGKGQHCKSTEHALSWSQKGPSGPTGLSGPSGPGGPSGPAGTAGPTSLTTDLTVESIGGSPESIISHTVTPAEAGLTIISTNIWATDNDGTTGGATSVFCNLQVNGINMFDGPSIRFIDNGVANGDSHALTMTGRQTLAAGDVVSLTCYALFGDNEAAATGQLLLERVSS